MDDFVSMLLTWISYEQKTETLEIFDVVKTVLARAMWTTGYSSQLVVGFIIYVYDFTKLYYERPAALRATQGVRPRWRNTTQDVIWSLTPSLHAHDDKTSSNYELWMNETSLLRVASNGGIKYIKYDGKSIQVYISLTFVAQYGKLSTQRAVRF